MIDGAKTPAKAGATAEPGRTKAGKLKWLIGWVLVPLSVVGALFLSGVHIGARHPQGWMARAVLWMFDAEPQLAPSGPPEPLARRLRLAVLPSTGHSLKLELSPDALADLVERGAGPSVAQLDCAAVCELSWVADHPDRAFIEAQRCVLTPATTTAQAILDCEARVQRGKPAP